MSTKFLAIFLGLLVVGIASVTVAQDIAYKEDPEAAKRMTLLLKDFEPHPMVHLPVHNVPQARFPAIDLHNHVNDAQGINGGKRAARGIDANMDEQTSNHRDPDWHVGRQIPECVGHHGEAISRPLHGVTQDGLEQD